jgi:hypothetical protein
VTPVGQTQQATAACMDQAGNQIPLPPGDTANWSTSDATVATVTQDATNPLLASVVGVGAGTCTITCTVTNVVTDGSHVFGSAIETVAAPPPPQVASVIVTLQ